MKLVNKRTISLVIVPNPFSTDKIIKEVEIDTFENLFKHVNTPLGIDYALIIDKDKRIHPAEYDFEPETDHVIIRMMPAGDGGNSPALRESGTGLKAGGAATAIAGVGLFVAGFFTGGATWVYALAGLATVAGISIFTTGVVLYNTELPTPDASAPTNRQSTRGASNRMNFGGRVPILLGKHLITPDYATNPVEFDLTSSYRLKQVFCAGYSSIKIDEDTMKIGDTPLRNFVDDDGNPPIYSIHQGLSIQHPEFDTRESTAFLSKQIPFVAGRGLSWDTLGGFTRGVIYTLKENFTTVVVGLDFPNGLYRVDSEGKKKTLKLTVYLGYSATGIPGTFINLGAVQVSGSSSLQLKKQISFSLTKDSYGHTITLPTTDGVGHIRLFATPAEFEPYFMDADEISYSGSGDKITIKLDPAGYPALNGFQPRVGDYYEGRIFTAVTETVTNTFSVTVDPPFSEAFTITKTEFGSTFNKPEYQQANGFSNFYDPTSTSNICDVYAHSISTKFQSSAGDTYPILPSEKAKWTTIGLDIQGDTLSGTSVTNFNFIGQTEIQDYDHSSGTWVTRLTSNPASMFLHVLTDPRINKRYATNTPRIDWDSLEEWHDFCRLGGYENSTSRPLECNAYITYDITFTELLNLVCSTGFASWNMVDGVYKIIIDTYRPNVIQFFTPRNSWDFTGTKAFIEPPEAIEVSFLDAESGYQESTATVLNPSFTGGTPEIVDEIKTQGITHYYQAYTKARYFLRNILLRPESFSFKADIENIVVTRGDRIRVSHDVPLIGLGVAKIKSIITSGSDVSGITIDDVVSMEAGKDYGVVIRTNDGTTTSVTANVVNSEETDTSVLSFSPFITGDDVDLLELDLLVMFGERGTETLDGLVAKIEPQEDFTATISMILYDEDIYDSSEVIPTYVPQLTLPGDSGGEANYSGVYSPSQITDAITNSNIAVNSAIGALHVKRNDTTLTSVEKQYRSAFDSTGENLFYVNYTQGLKLYRKQYDFPEIGIPVTTDAIDTPVSIGGDVVAYTKLSDGRLYVYNIALDNEEAITTSAGNKPVVDPITFGQIYYIHADGTVWLTGIDNSSDGTQYLPMIVESFTVLQSGVMVFASPENESILYAWDGVNPAYAVTSSAGSDPVPDIDEGQFLYINYNDMNTYITTISDTSDGLPLITATSDIATNADGDLVYTALSGDTYVSYINGKDTDYKFVVTSLAGITFTADITEDAFTVTNVQEGFLKILYSGARITGDGIPDDTFILLTDTENNSFTMTKNATTTIAGNTMVAVGEKYVMDASEGILPGTIEGNKLVLGAVTSDKIADGAILQVNLDPAINTTLDGVAKFSTAEAPNGSFLGQDLSIELTDLGQYEITLGWTYNQGNLLADTFKIFYSTGNNTTPSTPDGNDPNETYSAVSGAQYTTFVLPGVYVESNVRKFYHYSFGISAGRLAGDGVVYYEPIVFDPAGDWANRFDESVGVNGGVIKAGRIDSVVTVSGNPVSRIDLDNGDITLRNSSGQVVFDFDNNDSSGLGALQLTGTVASGNYSPGSAGWQIKNNGDAEFNNGVFRGTLDGVEGSFGTINSGSYPFMAPPTTNRPGYWSANSLQSDVVYTISGGYLQVTAPVFLPVGYYSFDFMILVSGRYYVAGGNASLGSTDWKGLNTGDKTAWSKLYAPLDIVGGIDVAGKAVFSGDVDTTGCDLFTHRVYSDITESGSVYTKFIQVDGGYNGYSGCFFTEEGSGLNDGGIIRIRIDEGNSQDTAYDKITDRFNTLTVDTELSSSITSNIAVVGFMADASQKSVPVSEINRLAISSTQVSVHTNGNSTIATFAKNNGTAVGKRFVIYLFL